MSSEKFEIVVSGLEFFISFLYFSNSEYSNFEKLQFFENFSVRNRIQFYSFEMNFHHFGWATHAFALMFTMTCAVSYFVCNCSVFISCTIPYFYYELFLILMYLHKNQMHNASLDGFRLSLIFFRHVFIQKEKYGFCISESTVYRKVDMCRYECSIELFDTWQLTRKNALFVRMYFIWKPSCTQSLSHTSIDFPQLFPYTTIN